jgi:hypothetical protein
VSGGFHSIIELQQELVTHIDNLNIQANIGIRERPIMPQDIRKKSRTENTLSCIHPDRVAQLQDTDLEDSDLEFCGRADKISQVAEQYLQLSSKARAEYVYKALGRTRSGRITTLPQAKKPNFQKSYRYQTKGIEASEICRRKAADECQRCAWPRAANEGHETLDCVRSVRKKKRTANFPKNQQWIYSREPSTYVLSIVT